MNDKSFDLIVDESREKILKTINHTGLPLSVLAYILQDITNAVKQQAVLKVAKEKEQREETEGK